MDSFVSSIQAFTQGDYVRLTLVALGLLIATAMLSHVCTRFIRRVASIDGTPIPSASIIVNTARIVVWGLGICLVLSSCLGVNVNALVAAMGVGGIALSLGLQSTIANYWGGVQATVLKIVQPGERIKVSGITGVVQDISWRQTVLRDADEVEHIVPNAIIASSVVSKMGSAAEDANKGGTNLEH